MTITLEAYFEDGLYKIFAGGDSDSGISVKGATAEECATAFKPYLEDYLLDARRDDIIDKLTDKLKDNDGHIDMSDKEVMLFDGDTEKQTGEAFKVLGITLDEDYGIAIDIDCHENDVWDAEDLSIYELELLLKEVK